MGSLTLEDKTLSARALVNLTLPTYLLVNLVHEREEFSSKLLNFIAAAADNTYKGLRFKQTMLLYPVYKANKFYS